MVLGRSWSFYYILNIIFLWPMTLSSKQLSPRSQQYIQMFQQIFPEMDIKSKKIFDFARNASNVHKLIVYHTQSCLEKDQKHRLIRRSVYRLLEPPMEHMFTTFLPPTLSTDPDLEHYCYIDQQAYDNFTLTDSELALSKEGWDYSPYIPPGETTTEFIFPSWNYGGHCPEAFWKDLTGGELDPYDVTPLILPDNENGYTDPESLKVHSFADLLEGIWDTVSSLRHKCDNYTTLFSCLQGPRINSPNLLDNINDPID